MRLQAKQQNQILIRKVERRNNGWARYYGTGRRKKSIARYIYYLVGKVTINKRDIDEYLVLKLEDLLFVSL